MKLFAKINLVAIAAVSLTSCLKNRNDIGGMRTDSGTITTTIAEPEYARQDNEHVIGFGYYFATGFPFSGPNEQVKFFNLHVAQPRETKLSGPLRVKISMTSVGSNAIPAGAITVPAEVEFPAFTENSRDLAVKFTVNKAALVPGADYVARFSITGVNQGTFGKADNEVDVHIYDGKYEARYDLDETVLDPANVVKMDKNYKPVFLLPPSFLGTANPAGATNLTFFDEYFYALFGTNDGLSTLVNNLTTGTTATRLALIYPTYGLDANDNLIRVVNSLTGANYNVTLNGDATNKFVYTAQDNRTFNTSFNVTLTAPLPAGASSSRTFKIMQKFSYHRIQARVF